MMRLGTQPKLKSLSPTDTLIHLGNLNISKQNWRKGWDSCANSPFSKAFFQNFRTIQDNSFTSRKNFPQFLLTLLLTVWEGVGKSPLFKEVRLPKKTTGRLCPLFRLIFCHEINMDRHGDFFLRFK